MNRSSIDTLRLATRLRKEGVPDDHADALARALGDELRVDPTPPTAAGGRPDREDLLLEGTLRGDVRTLKWAVGVASIAIVAAFVLLFGGLLDVIEEQGLINARVAALDTKIDEKFVAVDHRFDGMGQRFSDVGQRFNDVSQRFDDVGRRFDRVEALLRELIAGAGSSAGAGVAGTPADSLRR